MLRWLSAGLLLLAACGGARATGPQLRTEVAEERWFVSPARCSQGPFEISAGAGGARWGEGVELVAATPRRIRLTAVLELDGKEIARSTVTVNPRGDAFATEVNDKPENQRCVAGAVELSDKLGGGGSGTPPVGDTMVGGGGTIPGGGTVQSPPVTLQVDTGHGHGATGQVVGFSWPTFRLDPPSLAVGAHIRIRFWSSVPNDLDGVAFGLIRTVTRPSVPDAEWEAHVRGELEAERMREQAAAQVPPPAATPEVSAPDPTDPARERARREHDRTAALDRLERDKREAEQRAERDRRRLAYCDAHHGDTSCWGPGGFTVHADLAHRADERDAYCKTQPLEARCWDQDQWFKHQSAWQRRIEAANKARTAPPEPTGPPPAAMAETQPPMPSQHADWRPGYWFWNGTDWRWIGGAWNVPDADIAAQLTAQAPAPPPAEMAEAPPAAPAPAAVWTPGYWAWSTTTWVWVGGSWQMPPAPRVEWRATRWQPRGPGVILDPGRWVTIQVRP